MPHNIKGFSAPVSNNNIANVYSEVSLTTTDETYISPLGGLVPNTPSDTGELIQLVSADAADVGDIKVIGLDINFKYISEIVKLNGIIPVQTTQQFTRINDLVWYERTAFSGLIKAQNTLGDTDYRSCSVDSQLSVDSLYSVPADRKWQVPLVYAAIIRDANQQSTGSINLYYRDIGFAYRRPFRFSMSMSGNSSSNYENLFPFELDGPVDIYNSAQASDIGTDIVARLTVKLNP